MIYLSNELWFPNTNSASDEGLLAVGGDLSTERLLLAYKSGIFPWFEEGEPILWWSPDPRMVLVPSDLKISKSLQKTLRKGIFEITFNAAFSKVIEACSQVKRPGQQGTWITSEMKQSYVKLHEMGYALSVEVWKEGALVGGLYGVDLKEHKVFCGESMFSKVSDASKVGFCNLVSVLQAKNYSLIDCQVYTAHLESLGALEVSRKEFLSYLQI